MNREKEHAKGLVLPVILGSHVGSWKASPVEKGREELL